MGRTVTRMGSSNKHKHIYNDTRWPKLRKAAWLRDGGLCRKCGKAVLTSGDRFHPLYFECDHIIGLDQDEGLAFELDNVQTLHKKCHRVKTTVQQSNRLQRDDGW